MLYIANLSQQEQQLKTQYRQRAASATNKHFFLSTLLHVQNKTAKIADIIITIIIIDDNNTNNTNFHCCRVTYPGLCGVFTDKSILQGRI